MVEPVRRFDLGPQDYVCLVDDLVRAEVPLLVVSFQGYEVTLPKAWPYLDAVFSYLNATDIRRSFITNGMLLHKHADRLLELDPHRITVSLDGAHGPVNDRLRGLNGAFEATLRSVRTFLKNAPSLADRIGFASTLYDEENAKSLLAMPSLLADLGVTRWMVAVELDVDTGEQRPVRSRRKLADWAQALREAAEQAGIRFHVNDEFGFFRPTETSADTAMRARHVYDPEFIVRVDPNGDVRMGREILRVCTSGRARRYHPGRDDFAELIGYWKRVSERWPKAIPASGTNPR